MGLNLESHIGIFLCSVLLSLDSVIIALIARITEQRSRFSKPSQTALSD